jgi:signal transduction histidine kinase
MSPDGMVAFDAQKKVQFVNPAFVRMTGLSEIQLKGLSHQEFTDLLSSRCAPSGVFAGIEVLKKSMTRQRIELDSAGKFVLQVELVKPSQSIEGLELPLSMLLNFRDVTSDSQLEQDKTDFLATAAHELRTPMASVYGFSEVLLMQENSAESQREFLGIIYRQSQHMVTIINDLLDLARIEARQARDFVFAPLQVQDAVRELVKNFKVPTGRDAPVLYLPTEPVLIKVDAVKFNQALQNVLSNAYKFSPDGGAVHLSVQLHSNSELSVSVKDAGIGMTQNQINNVFTRFYRADTVAALPGTGLGMNIVKEIMRLHSGDVLIDSELGIGTRVSLILPVVNP